jgi:hypothetical protein
MRSPPHLLAEYGLPGLSGDSSVKFSPFAGAVDFVGRDLDVALHVQLARVVQEVVGALDVGLDEARRFLDGAVDVRLGGEVEHDLRARHRLAHRLWVADVALHEADAPGIHQVAMFSMLPAYVSASST